MADQGREIDHNTSKAAIEPGGLQYQLGQMSFKELRQSYAQLRPSKDVGEAQAQAAPLERPPIQAEAGQKPGETPPVTIHGKTYSDYLKIPGNEPVELKNPNGQPVLGPNGQPVFGPSRANLDKVASELGQNIFNMSKFGHRGDWDFQRMSDDKGNEVFTEKYRDFANIAIGYAYAANGHHWQDAASVANLYCGVTTCDFPEHDRTKQYPNLSSRQVDDYKIGEALYRSRHPNNAP
ncbi:MAG: hypothetical protein P4L53_12480 [Candidatus Obscuribacterales bacterium]|nr:hypothetical protein [Candidatus Obscuribacterales bacterium]